MGAGGIGLRGPVASDERDSDVMTIVLDIVTSALRTDSKLVITFEM